MDATQILMIVLQLALTAVVAVAGWGIKNAIGAMKDAIKENAERINRVDEKQSREVEKLKTQLSDLKSDLPLVYVLREDFIRVLNNVDSKLDKLLSSNSTKEE